MVSCCHALVISFVVDTFIKAGDTPIIKISQ